MFICMSHYLHIHKHKLSIYRHMLNKHNFNHTDTQKQIITVL
jgi:hypothetical protein